MRRRTIALGDADPGTLVTALDVAADALQQEHPEPVPVRLATRERPTWPGWAVRGRPPRVGARVRQIHPPHATLPDSAPAPIFRAKAGAYSVTGRGAGGITDVPWP